MITSELNKKAWAIRKAAAKKWNCPVMEIAWGLCLKMAKAGKDEGMKSLKGRKYETKVCKSYEAPKGTVFYGTDRDANILFESKNMKKCKDNMDALKAEIETDDPDTWATKYWMLAEEPGDEILKALLKF